MNSMRGMSSGIAKMIPKLLLMALLLDQRKSRRREGLRGLPYVSTITLTVNYPNYLRYVLGLGGECYSLQ